MTERFELLERVGKGGMGVVWRARDGETGEIVALKLLHAIYAEDPDYVARFEREVEVARRIDSPHVVRVFGYGMREGVPYMAMEYVGGQSLRELIKAKGKLTWEEAKPLLRQVAEGLEAAHKAGVIHRDVKPSNILIAPDGSAKLADFGIARAADLTALTGSSTTIGTAAYMAPEGRPSEQSDLYGLGVVLYEMLTGAPPFAGESQQEVLLRHVTEAPDLSRLPEGTGRELAGWLLEKDPAKRPPGAGALLAALDGSSRVPPGTPAVAAGASSGAFRWRPIALLVAIPMLMLGAGLGVMFAVRGGDGGNRPPAHPETALAAVQAASTPTRAAPTHSPRPGLSPTSTTPPATATASPTPRPTAMPLTSTPTSLPVAPVIPLPPDPTEATLVNVINENGPIYIAAVAALDSGILARVFTGPALDYYSSEIRKLIQAQESETATMLSIELTSVDRGQSKVTTREVWRYLRYAKGQLLDCHTNSYDETYILVLLSGKWLIQDNTFVLVGSQSC